MRAVVGWRRGAPPRNRVWAGLGLALAIGAIAGCLAAAGAYGWPPVVAHRSAPSAATTSPVHPGGPAAVRGTLASARPPMVGGAPVLRVPAGWVSSTRLLTIGGLARSYLLVRPAAVPGQSLPVVIVLHGRGMTAAAIARTSGVLSVLGPAIAVFPSGYRHSWDAGRCCGVAHAAHVDDVGFLEATLRDVLRTQPDAAARRVYLIGYSNGGRMAMRMACADPGAFAGVAAVEAVPASPCRSMTPLPTLLVASANDPLLTVPPAGRPKKIQGWVEPTVGATVTELAHLDGCRGVGAVDITGGLTSTSWSACAGAGRLQYDLYRGGSHRWPAGNAATPAAQAVIARFLLGGPSASR